jgi:hypothetical protein
MKLLLLIYNGSTPDRISALLERHGASGYTALTHARGVGTTGRAEGTRAWPGDASVFFTVVPNEQARALRAAVGAYRDGAVAGERLHVATMPLEDFD